MSTASSGGSKGSAASLHAAVGQLRAVPELTPLTGFALDRTDLGLSLTSAMSESLGSYLLANPAYCAITGYSEVELRSRNCRDVIFADDVMTLDKSFDRLRSGLKAATDDELRFRRADDSVLLVRQRHSLIRNKTGEPFLFLGQTEPISTLKHGKMVSAPLHGGADSGLLDGDGRYRALIDSGADMIERMRYDRSRAFVSPISRTLLGFEPDEMIGRDFAMLLHPDDRERIVAAYKRIITDGGRETQSYRLRRRDGSYVWVEAHWATVQADPNRSICEQKDVVSIVRDISDRREKEAHLASMACHDLVSGLPNRVLFNERLEQALGQIDRGGTAAIASIDLDHFKWVNDTFGHAAGDFLLRSVAERLTACVRRSDTVARVGGDEFAVVLVGVKTDDEASAHGQRIVERLSAPYDIDGQHVAASVSVGIAMAPKDGVEPDTLLRNADIALYRAKAEGRNTYRLFDREMGARLRAKRSLELELRRALADHAFTVYYQPIVRLSSYRIVGLEALVRWQHPTRGLVSPAEFIPIAEDTGLIVELGKLVLREACRLAATWPPGIRLSVNLSPVQFRTGDLVDTVAGALDESGLAAHQLDLEITESVLMGTHEKTLGILRDLSDLGVGLSLDDFGTGYSSLSYLHAFQVDRIKIDRSFIGDLLQSEESGAIVRAVIRMGETLGMKTVAEGVETLEQLRRLRRDGCTEAQGYLLSKPRPSEEIPALLKAFDRIALIVGQPVGPSIPPFRP